MLIFGGENLKWHSSCDIDYYKKLQKMIEIYTFSNLHILNFVIIHMHS